MFYRCFKYKEKTERHTLRKYLSLRPPQAILRARLRQALGH